MDPKRCACAHFAEAACFSHDPSARFANSVRPINRPEVLKIRHRLRCRVGYAGALRAAQARRDDISLKRHWRQLRVRGNPPKLQPEPPLRPCDRETNPHSCGLEGDFLEDCSWDHSPRASAGLLVTTCVARRDCARRPQQRLAESRSHCVCKGRPCCGFCAQSRRSIPSPLARTQARDGNPVRNPLKTFSHDLLAQVVSSTKANQPRLAKPVLAWMRPIPSDGFAP